MRYCITESEAVDIAVALGNYNFAVGSDVALEHAYYAYGAMPISQIDKIASHINRNHLTYLGKYIGNQDGNKVVQEIYMGEKALEALFIDKQNLYSGDINFQKLDKFDVFETLGIEMAPVVEDITATTESIIHGYSYSAALEADMSDPFEKAFGSDTPSDNSTNNASGNGGEASGGSSPEDITATTDSIMNSGGSGGGSSGGGDAGGGDDFNLDGLDGGGDAGGGDANGGNNGSPDMLDEKEDDDDEKDDGTEDKKRIRKNMYRLHTIFKDSLDAMATFTPAYTVENSKKYYKVQNIISTADEILRRIIVDDINKLTVEDLTKKYLTLCNIYDISTRYLHEFKKEYRELAEKPQRAIATPVKVADTQLQQ
jgi:hypothetical protein